MDTAYQRDARMNIAVNQVIHASWMEISRFMIKPAFQNFKRLLCLIQGLELVLRNLMSQVELSYLCITNSSVHVLVIA